MDDRPDRLLGMTVMIPVVASLVGAFLWAIRDEHREREAAVVRVTVENQLKAEVRSFRDAA